MKKLARNRKPGQPENFNAGDYVKVHFYRRRPSLAGALCLVTSVTQKYGRWHGALFNLATREFIGLVPMDKLTVVGHTRAQYFRWNAEVFDHAL